MAKIPATAHDVANYFLMLSNENEGDAVSSLKLQKLLYYAQGLHLALTGEKLFGEKIKAWQHGPVVPVVWHAYKDSGSLTLQPSEDFSINKLSQKTRDFLDEVWELYGQFSAWKLRDMTHQERPYIETGRNEEIRPSVMRDFFKDFVKA